MSDNHCETYKTGGTNCSALSQGNKALRDKRFDEAIGFYLQALNSTPSLSRMINANLAFTRQQYHVRDDNLQSVLTQNNRHLTDLVQIFDADWYSEQYPEIGKCGDNPLNHYLSIGIKECREVNRLFDTNWYREQYPEVAVTGENPLLHFLRIGAACGCKPNELFDTKWYMNHYWNFLIHSENPLAHFLRSGVKIGCKPNENFDSEWYIKQYPDVASSTLNPLAHYYHFGRKEGRFANQASLIEEKKSSRHTGKSRGTLLCVSHDMEIAGAQNVLISFIKWILSTTYYDVRIVAMRSGANFSTFNLIAPVYCIESQSSQKSKKNIQLEIEEFAGFNVKGVFINSIASAGFFDYWNRVTPAVAYIHEFPGIIKTYGKYIDLLKLKVDRFVCDAVAVVNNLHEHFDIDTLNCDVVHPFVEDVPDNDFNKITKEIAREQLGVKKTDFLVMGCGTVHWRKSPEKFIEIASKIRSIKNPHFKFIWIGGGPDIDKCKSLVSDSCLDGIVDFIGYKPDIYDLLKAADVFLLPSEEDPFPLVCLEAGKASVPIVCFDDAGGIPELTSQGCGLSIPFGNTAAMADAVLYYYQNPEVKRQHGKKGQELITQMLTTSTAAPKLFHIIREAFALVPHVSVIVPNYNCGRFLDQRLSTIYQQTFQDFEIILLDDFSTDNSLQILKKTEAIHNNTALLINDENSGSPFHQWLKGMKHATGDLIWIAEADDYCQLNVLELSVRTFEDRNVFLSFVKTVPVGVDGNELGDYGQLYLNRINLGRWDTSYVATDHEEVNAALAIGNSIPNASAVVMRPFLPDPKFLETVTRMRMCGDWYFYLRAIRGGSVAYIVNSTNYHRRHGTTVTQRMEGSVDYFEELNTVRTYVSQHYRLHEQAKLKARAFAEAEIGRFCSKSENQKTELEDVIKSTSNIKNMPSILVVVSDLSPGGGQMFCIRLANAWAKSGGRAFLLNVQKYPDHAEVVKKIDRRISIFDANASGFNLRKLLIDYDIDIIHSAIWWADKFVYEHRDAILPHVRWVLTMHGCYETLLSNPEIDPEFIASIKGMLQRVHTCVYTAEKNKILFEKIIYPQRYVKIANGYERDTVTKMKRSDFALRDNSVVLCLASRAIPSKGWSEAVKAVHLLNADGYIVDLMLLGEGEEADRIRAANESPYIHCYGQVSNLQDFIAIADIGLLPSTFVGESMPLVLMEFMAQGKPIVATDIGEISYMLSDEAGIAGRIVPICNNQIDILALVEAIKEFLTNVQHLQNASENALRLFERFEMSTMLARYTSVYLD